MKKVRQRIAFMLAMLMAFAMVGCSGKKDDKEAKKIIADDKSVMDMTFTPPETYESVLRTIEKTTAGDIIQKELDYTLADESEYDYAYLYMEDVDLSNALDTEKLEKMEIDGRTFYIQEENDKSYQAYAQKDAHIYGFQYTASAEGKREIFNEAMEAIHFSDKMESVTDDITFEGLSYTIDEELPLYSTTTTLVEKQDGTVLKKSLQWNFGEDAENLTFRFVIRLFKNTTVDKEINEKYEYEEKTVGDITYKVLKPSEGKAAYEYFTQHGDDVYEIRNSGISNGWFGVTRSEESEAAFEKLLNSIHFE